MYLRFTQRTNTDGTVVRYVALDHNRRVDGKVKPDVLMNLGRVDQLDVGGLRRLAASITKHFGDSEGDEGSVPGPSDAVEAGLVKCVIYDSLGCPALSDIRDCGTASVGHRSGPAELGKCHLGQLGHPCGQASQLAQSPRFVDLGVVSRSCPVPPRWTLESTG